MRSEGPHYGPGMAGIEPATFRFVAQHLKHCAIAVTFCYGSTGYNFSCVFLFLESYNDSNKNN